MEQSRPQQYAWVDAAAVYSLFKKKKEDSTAMAKHHVARREELEVVRGGENQW